MNKLNHVAFIMDGNGRWGQKRKKGRNFGHLNGVKTVKKIVEKSAKLKIPIITFYVFSTENWKRPKSEINFLFKLIINYFKKELSKVILNGIKINIIGNINKLPSKIRTSLKSVISDSDGIFHQAALTSVPESFIQKEKYHSVNVIGTENIFKLAKDF